MRTIELDFANEAIVHTWVDDKWCVLGDNQYRIAEDSRPLFTRWFPDWSYNVARHSLGGSGGKRLRWVTLRVKP